MKEEERDGQLLRISLLVGAFAAGVAGEFEWCAVFACAFLLALAYHYSGQ